MGTSNAKTLNLQDSFLNKVRAEKKTIVIYLLNGFQVRGKVWGPALRNRGEEAERRLYAA